MVNYCCVLGCKRNSRSHPNLIYFGLPKELNRQIEWLKAGKREDLIPSDQLIVRNPSHRFCSRHFHMSQLKHKSKLFDDAVPSLCLSGDEDSDEETKPLTHEGVLCNNCCQSIVGPRYKCLQCPDYDLCRKCESGECHPQHAMLRLQRPVDAKKLQNLTEAYKNIFETNDSTEKDTFYSSDDEPITKYLNKDTDTELTDEIKDKIRLEVNRVMSLKENVHSSKKKKQVKRKMDVGDKNAVLGYSIRDYIEFADVDGD